MENLFIELQNRIAINMPTLSTIDEDYGQLELSSGEDHYPVVFPCVLISNVNTTWDNTSPGLQTGASTITVRLCFDCYDDSHYGAVQPDKMNERSSIRKELNNVLSYFRLDKSMTPLVRVKSTDYTLPGRIKVYETTYRFTIRDTITPLQ
ncbi:MAG: hypothetical protein ACRDDZ_06265 [Marinifilaceae bacterium]